MKHPLCISFLVFFSLFSLGLILFTVSDCFRTPTNLGWARTPSNPPSRFNKPNTNQAGQTYRSFPVYFEANQGQAEPSVKFLSNAAGFALELNADEAVLTFRDQRRGRNRQSAQKQGPNPAQPSLPETKELLRMRLVGGNHNARIEGLESLPGKVNYYLGSNPSRWHTGVPTFAKVRVHGALPGIDLVYYGNQGALEHDFEVAPGADPSLIRLAIAVERPTGGKVNGNQAILSTGAAKGSEILRIDSQGNLMVRLASGEVNFRKPLIYQSRGEAGLADRAERVEGRYVLKAGGEIGFEIGAYDHHRLLIIDPILAYSTYFMQMGAIGMGIDGSGNAYLLGQTYSQSAYQATLTALNPQGTQTLYTTHFGPLGGSSGASALAVDSLGNTYITGNGAPEMPTTSGAYSATCPSICNTPFAAKFSPVGTLTYSTFLGPSNAAAHAIAADSNGDAYVTGTVASNDLPVVNAFQSQFAGMICTGCANAFVQEINPTGSQLIYSTYFGTGSVNAEVVGTGIAVDRLGSAYIVGNVAAVPLLNPLEQGVGSAFLAKFSPDGSSLEYSTRLGGSGSAFMGQTDTAAAIAVDSAGDAYVTGVAATQDFPVTMNAFKASCNESALEACLAPQAYVLKVDPAGASFLYSTLIGAGSPSSLTVDSSGNAWVTGTTFSNYFPVVQPIQSGLQQNAFPGSDEDAFVSQLNSSGIPAFSTYLGGGFTSTTGVGVASDGTGNAYVAGSISVGNDAPVDFPVVNPIAPPQNVAQFAFPGALYLAKISPGAGPVLSLSPWYTAILNLRDVSSSAVTLNSITTSSTLILEGGTCGPSIPAAGGCTLIVYPEDPQNPKGGTLTISSSASSSPQTFNLQYSPIGTNQFFVSRSRLEFPVQIVGSSSAPQTVTITNLEYPNSVGITSIATSIADPTEGIAGDFSQTNNCPPSLAPGASCTVSVQYQPTAGADGPETGQLQINTNTSPSNYTVYLTGLRSSESIVPSTQSTQFAVSNSTVNFGSQIVGATPLPRVLTLTNADTQTVTLSGFTLPAPFSQTNNCTGPLAPHASCRVSVSFVPVGNGNFTGTLNVTNSGRGSPAAISLAGAGLIPSSLGISPLSLQFGSIIAGTSESLPLTLTNNGAVILSNLQYSLSPNFSQTNNCGESLAPAATCTVTVSFTPSTVGALNGTLTIQFSGNGSPQVISLSGTGNSPLEIVPAQISFGQQMVGAASAPQTVEMGNGGPTPVTISSVSVSAGFQITSNNCLTTLTTNTDCTLQVEFTPTAAGSQSGSLTVTASDIQGTHAIPLSGTGVTLPVVGLAPGSLNFPAQLMSTTSTAQTVTVSNSGNSALQISSINLSGPFAQTSTCSVSVPVNGTCSISVTYTPTASGGQTGTMTLTDNAANSPQSVQLSGTGQDFSLAAASGGSTAATVAPGQTATFNLSLAPASGLAGSVSFTCSGAPSQATCGVNPTTATLSASSATPVTVTVTTAAPSRVYRGPQPPSPLPPGLWMPALLILLATLGMGMKHNRWRRAWLFLAVAALTLILLPSCGGGGGSGGGGGPSNPGTPAGSYSLTLTGTFTSGTATVQHSLNLTLTVS